MFSTSFVNQCECFLPILLFVLLTFIWLSSSAIARQRRSEFEHLSNHVFQAKNLVNAARIEPGNRRKGEMLRKATASLKEARNSLAAIKAMFAAKGSNEFWTGLDRINRSIEATEREIAQIQEPKRETTNDTHNHTPEGAKFEHPPIVLPHKNKTAYLARLAGFLSDAQLKATGFKRTYTRPHLLAKFDVEPSTEPGQRAKDHQIQFIEKHVNVWMTLHEKRLTSGIVLFQNHLRDRSRLRDEDCETMRGLTYAMHLYRDLLRARAAALDESIPISIQICQTVEAYEFAKQSDSYDLCLQLQTKLESLNGYYAHWSQRHSDTARGKEQEFERLLARPIHQPEKATWASSRDLETGRTTTSRKGSDGSRTVTVTDKDGNPIPEKTKRIPPKGKQLPSASSTDLNTGVTTTSTGNQDGSRTIIATDRDGIPVPHLEHNMQTNQ